MKLKFGIIGTNFISDRFVDAAKNTDAEIVAVYSRTYETGKSFAEKHGIKEIFTDLDEFLKGTSANAVYIASPNFMHMPQSIAAMKAGKHVLCEKPIASNSHEYQLMKKVSEETGCALVEAMRPAFDPATEIIMSSLCKLGTVRRALFDFSQYSSRYDRFKDGEDINTFNPALSNAAVMDLGVYCIYMCLRLFGKPISITSESVFLDNGFEASGNALFRYDSLIADIHYSKISDSVIPCCIQGENGSLIFSKTSSPHDISICYRDGTTESIQVESVPNNMIYEIKAFAEIAEGRLDSDQFSHLSDMVISTIDTIRKNNGISFPADAE